MINGYYVIVMTVFAFIIRHNDEPTVLFMHNKALMEPVPRKSEIVKSKNKYKFSLREDPEKAFECGIIK